MKITGTFQDYVKQGNAQTKLTSVDMMTSDICAPDFVQFRSYWTANFAMYTQEREIYFGGKEANPLLEPKNINKITEQLGTEGYYMPTDKELVKILDSVKLGQTFKASIYDLLDLKYRNPTNYDHILLNLYDNHALGQRGLAESFLEKIFGRDCLPYIRSHGSTQTRVEGRLLRTFKCVSVLEVTMLSRGFVENKAGNNGIICPCSLTYDLDYLGFNACDDGRSEHQLKIPPNNTRCTMPTPGIRTCPGLSPDPEKYLWGYRPLSERLAEERRSRYPTAEERAAGRDHKYSI